MNIFKILANGDGTVNEPNISAFIGYLLDPYQDHGLGMEFLKRFLEFVDDDLNFYSYDYEVELEQAFREGDKSKQIVDIVIACFPNQKKSLKESITLSSTQNDRAVQKIYLIENKVTYNAKKAEQLKNQFNSTVKSLNISPDLVFPIYLTPDIEVYDKEFSSFDEDKKRHFVWINKNELPHYELLDNEFEKMEAIKPNKIEKSIYRIFKDLIKDESNGNIEAINEYTRHTLVSFVKFIENSFKSEIQEKKEKKERRNTGEYTQNLINLNIEYDVENKLNLVKEELIKRDQSLLGRISNADIISRPLEPGIWISTDDIIIYLFAKPKSGTIKFLYGVDKNNKVTSRSNLDKLASKLDLKINGTSTAAYAWTAEMKKDKFDIDDFNTIYNSLNKVINQIPSLNDES